MIVKFLNLNGIIFLAPTRDELSDPLQTLLIF